MKEETNIELLDSWGAGNTAAGGELLRRHFESLYRFFAMKVDGQIEDLVQRTLLGAVEGRDRIRDTTRFRSYLLGIARFVLIDHLRSRAKSFDVLDEPVALAAPTPPSLIANKEEQRLLLRALRKLPLRLQIVVGLYYFEGLKVAEIAEVTEAPTGTVKDRLATARKKAREIVEELAGSPALAASTLGRFETWLRDLPSPRPT